ncbi:MAG: class I SAM-dependent methyltransferase [Flavobacteriales bacterium]
MKNQDLPNKAKDYLVTGETFQLLYDAEKDMLVTFPQPKDENLANYYESKDYISHTDSKKGLVSFLYQTVKKIALKDKVKLINKLKKGKGDLLDIGAGTGDFLLQSKNQSWNVTGVEPNQKAKELAQKKGLTLFNSLADVEQQKFDIITLWHVLEHLPDLEKTIFKIESLLKPSGVLIIAVPNYKSYDASYYKEFWAAYDVPRHLWHFSQKSMRFIFSKTIELIKIKPMIFDSFYVSLLSEKNKTGKQNFIHAFYIGLRSNISALTSKEYSSLIYCYKKKN